MNEMIINVPYPISTNRYKGLRVAGKIPLFFVTKEGKEFKKICSDLAKEEGDKLNLNLPLNIRFDIDITVYPKLPKDWQKREKKDPFWYLELKTLDVDNCLKVLLDSFNEVVYTDDKKIFSLKIRRGYPIQDGGAKVIFREYNQLTS